MFKYIFFDLDGTLTESDEGITKSVAYALFKFGIEEEPKKLTPFIGPPLFDSFKRFYGFSDEQAKEAVRIYRKRFDSIGKFENKVYDGVIKMLDGLKKQGRILAVSSSKPELFVRQITDRFNLSSYFDEITGSRFDGTRAEKSGVIEETVRRLKMTDSQRNETVFVGDRLYDVVGAHQCNIKCVGVRFGYSVGNELEEYGADYICDTVKDLNEFLINGSF